MSKIKQVKIIPDNEVEFIDALSNIDISHDKKQFFIQSLYYDIGHVDDCDDFYIDKPYCFNLYDYKQKFTVTHQLKARKFGFTNKTETNFFNFDRNLLSDDETKYLKLKNKIGYKKYYDYVVDLLPWFEEADEFLIVNRPPAGLLNEHIFNDSVIDLFVDYLIKHFNMGLWLNNFNNYSLRYNPDTKRLYSYDPDMFFVLEHNEDVCHLKTPEEFIDTYRHYKLRNKDIIYRIEDPYKLTVEVLDYMYYSYWLLERTAQAFRKL